MRILFVTQVMVDEPHGGSRHVLAVVRELRRLGHEVCLVAPGQSDVTDIERLRPPAPMRPGARLEAVQAALVAQYVRAHRPDVAYVRISASTLFVPLTLAALRVPIVLELNGSILDELAKLGASDAKVSIVKHTLRRAVRVAHAMVVPGRPIANHAIAHLGARDVVVVENGADLEVAQPGDRLAARRALGLPPDVRTLAFAGTFSREQRLDLLFEAHAALSSKYEHQGGLGLLLAGGGARQADVDSAMASPAGRQVSSYGRVPHERAVELLRAADVCVNVRVGDLGMKPLEYAAIGRRMALFWAPGAERLDSLYPGLEAVHSIRDESAESVASAIEKAFSAEAAHGPLPVEAIERARAQLGWGETARSLVTILEDAVRLGARRRP